jgi:hypothetical protein
MNGTKAQLVARLYGEPVPPGRAPEVRPHASSARTRVGLCVAARTEVRTNNCTLSRRLPPQVLPPYPTFAPGLRVDIELLMMRRH